MSQQGTRAVRQQMVVAAFVRVAPGPQCGVGDGSSRGSSGRATASGVLDTTGWIPLTMPRRHHHHHRGGGYQWTM